MRKFLLALPLLLTSCATGGGLTQEQVNTVVAQIQAYTAQACAAQPTVASATALISAFYAPATPYIALVNSVGEAFCKAPVTAAGIRRGAVTQTRIVQTPKGPVAAQGTSYR